MPRIKKKSVALKTANKPIKKTRRFYLIAVAVVILLLVILLLVKVFSVARIEDGSQVSLDYTLYLENGTVFDTSIESVGVEAGLSDSEYSPLSFTLGAGEVMPAFEEEIIGLRVGSNKRFTLTPDRAYGERDETLIKEFLRHLNLTKYSNITLESYSRAFQDEPEVGKEVNLPNLDWDFRITGLDDENVTLEALLDVGDVVRLPSVKWDTVVVDKDDELILLKQNPEVGDYIPAAGNPRFAVVTSVGDETFTADANHVLAGKTVTFEIEIKSINNNQ